MAEKILFLDNNFRLLTLISERLAYLGYDIITASRVHDAVLKAIVLPPDLIVCDVLMPELNGWELKRLLSQIPTLAGVPIVFLSTHDTLPPELYDPSVGVVELVKKPYGMEDLAAAVTATLARQRARHRLAETPLAGSLAAEGAGLVDLCQVLALREFNGVVTLSAGGNSAVLTWIQGGLIDAAAGDRQGEEAWHAAVSAPVDELVITIEPLPVVPPRPTITKALPGLIAEAMRRRNERAVSARSGDEPPSHETDEQFLERIAATGLVRRIGAASGR